MDKVKLVHWKAAELAERENILKAVGFQVDSDLEGGNTVLKELAGDPPAAIVIDLSRLPSQGRDFALTIRKRKGTRFIPIIFVGGDPEKVIKVQELLPDARYTSWDAIGDALREATAHPPPEPVVPESTFAAYAGKLLVEKLGIKPGMLVVVINQPAGFEDLLHPLPDGVQLHEVKTTPCDLSIWFCYSIADLDEWIPDIVRYSLTGPVWIAWPKQASQQAGDLTQQIVRQTGLENGLVDYKISSINETWSGLLFRKRGHPG